MNEERIKLTIPILGNVSINFSEISYEIYQLYKQTDEENRQREIGHLGLISYAFDGINHSRYDYVFFQCVISELIEKNFKGTTSAQGSIKIDGYSRRGNEIIKSWFLLSNFGHCFNTIGDEKSLILFCNENKGFKSFLLRSIKDNRLRKWSNDVIKSFDYTKFHHIISIVRIYKSLRRKTQLQNEILQVYKMLLLDSSEIDFVSSSERLDQLRSIYFNIRNLAIISLDTENSAIPINLNVLSIILSYDFFHNKIQQTELSEILNPQLNLLYNILYLNSRSQAYQRSYEIRSMLAIKNMNNKEILNTAIHEGFVTADDCHLVPFLRKSIKNGDKNRLELFRESQKINRTVNSLESSVDFNPFENRIIVDFYLDVKKFKNSNLPLICTQLVNYSNELFRVDIEAVLDIVEPGLKEIHTGAIGIGLTENQLMSLIEPFKNLIVQNLKVKLFKENLVVLRDLLWTMIRFHIKDQYYFDIDKSHERISDYFGIMIRDSKDSITTKIRSKIENTSDSDRAFELKHLNSIVSRKFKGTVLAMTERITLYDYSKAPEKRVVTDIDSVVLKFNRKELVLEFMESKNTKKRREAKAKSDLRKNFVKVLNEKSKGYRIVGSKNYGAKIRIKHST